MLEKQHIAILLDVLYNLFATSSLFLIKKTQKPQTLQPKKPPKHNNKLKAVWTVIKINGFLISPGKEGMGTLPLSFWIGAEK